MLFFNYIILIKKYILINLRDKFGIIVTFRKILFNCIKIILAFIIIQVYTIFCQKEKMPVGIENTTVLSQLSDIVLII